MDSLEPFRRFNRALRAANDRCRDFRFAFIQPNDADVPGETLRSAARALAGFDTPYAFNIRPRGSDPAAFREQLRERQPDSVGDPSATPAFLALEHLRRVDAM